jgi:CheY-like chemotaxis protein
LFDFAKISGGRVDVKNRKNGGAKISLRIPYVEANPIKSGLVLLVEDNIQIRETIRDTLRKMGHSVLEANSAEEALNLVHISDITHIITDLMLEDEMTGYDLAKHVRDSGKPIPIFVVTALPKSNALRLRAAQSFPVLHKPFSDIELAALFHGHDTL